MKGLSSPFRDFRGPFLGRLRSPSPALRFTNGEQGAWYDPSDLSTMFQDSAGTTPVTAIGEARTEEQLMVKCCNITAGMLSELVTIERNTPAPDGEGGYTDSWVADPVGGVWAMVKAVGGSERWLAERVTPGNRFRFIIRFRGDGKGAPYYSAGDRVVYNGRTYGITSVVDIENDRRYLEIMALENKPS